MVYGDCYVIDQNGLNIMTNHEIAFHKASYLFLAQFVSYPTVFFSPPGVSADWQI